MRCLARAKRASDTRLSEDGDATGFGPGRVKRSRCRKVEQGTPVGLLAGPGSLVDTCHSRASVEHGDSMALEKSLPVEIVEARSQKSHLLPSKSLLCVKSAGWLAGWPFLPMSCQGSVQYEVTHGR
jgi:hypothetical protein